MAIAMAMEEEAARRYRQMSDRMRLQSQDSLQHLFAFLASIEEKHAEQIRERARESVGSVPDAAAIRWELPEKFEEEEGHSYLLTPYRALSIATRNEDRAFAFFSYLAAHASKPEIRQLAEELGKDELAHAGLLRRERRKAWRFERPTQSSIHLSNPQDINAFLARVAAIEAFTANAHRALSATLATQGRTFEARVFEEAAQDEERSAGAAASRAAGPVMTFSSTMPETLRDGLRLLEYAFNQYAEVAETASDEAMLAAAQEFEARALKRLSHVQGLIGEAYAREITKAKN